MIQVAIMGHGVVGCGVAEVLLKNAATIADKAGESIEIARILDLRAFPDLPYSDKFTTRFEDILGDDAIRIVVETMGGLHPAYDYVKACLQAGKSVVTSNKELVAQKGDELLAIAKENNLNFLFEASVGGGIPILRPLDQCLAANEVYEVTGILNGTTNFMLAKMIDENMAFDEALSLAQKLGFAERDPSADIDGLDACRKICILASLAFGKHVYPAQVHTEGIRNITLTDVRYAAAAGGALKLIGRAVREGNQIDCTVAPMVVPKENLLSNVQGVFNAILVRGDAVGDTVFYGRGAGKLPTASAVVADVIDEAKHMKNRKYFCWGPAEPDYVRDYRMAAQRTLLRFSCADKAAAEAQVRAVFGAVEAVTAADVPANEWACIVPKMPISALEEKLALLQNMQLLSRLALLDEGGSVC